MLYLSWAEMGMMGAPSATVPAEQTQSSVRTLCSGSSAQPPQRLTLHEGQDLLVLLLSLALLHQVDLVLQDQDMLQLHDLYGSQMLRRLRLRTRLVPRWTDTNTAQHSTKEIKQTV